MTRVAFLFVMAWQAMGEMAPAPGMFLVAQKQLGDPNFVETVVLLIQYDAKGAMGLVINDRSRIPLVKLYPQAKDKEARLFIGGPVQQSGAQFLIRTSVKPERGKQVVGDVYLTLDEGLVEKAVNAGEPAVRVYLGYSGWGPKQLDRELEMGAWHVLKGDAGMVFDGKPETVWERLMRKTNPQLAW